MQLWGQIFQVLGSILLLYSYVPQVISLIKSKNADGISTQFWFILTIGLGCVAANMAISNVPMLMLLTQIANTICALVTLILVIKYKNVQAANN
ncbi:MAG: PQ-loop domain-containing transporter [Sarcina sp.]